MAKPQSANGSEAQFEFIETPKAPAPTFEKVDEDCGVRTTSVSTLETAHCTLHTADLRTPPIFPPRGQLPYIDLC